MERSLFFFVTNGEEDKIENWGFFSSEEKKMKRPREKKIVVLKQNILVAKVIFSLSIWHQWILQV